jgi:hypothetical protein
MFIHITTNLLWIIAGVWYGIGFASLVFWNAVSQGWKNMWRDLVMKFWRTTTGYLIASIFGPVVFMYGFLIWIFFDALVNKRR